MEANEEVSKLEAAVATLGGEKSAHAKPLLDALKMARAQSKVSPVRERMESCRKFIERAKKRVMRAEELITKATEQKAVFLLEVEEAEERSKQLESEAAAPVSSEPVVADLQRQIDALILERDSLRGMQKTMPGEWCSDGPPKLEAIPPMPTSDLQDLEMWLSNRNCELRNALEFGDTAIIAKVGALVGHGTAALTSFATVAPMEGTTRSTLMAALIDSADAKRRCLPADSSRAYPSSIGNQV